MKFTFSNASTAFLFLILLFQGCDKPYAEKVNSQTTEQLKLNSDKIAAKNPLLPKLENKLWANLLECEERLKNGDKKAEVQFLVIADKLTKLHPFNDSKSETQLGKVIWNKVKNTIEIPAVTTSPKSDDYLELILCNQNGRSHETLLITGCRPLHLEIMLHFAGFSKEENPSSFRLYLAVPGKEIPISRFLLAENSELPEILLWKFTGSPYSSNNYPPDMNGDHILLWNRYDAVLQNSDENISSGQTKILINRKNCLPNGTKVKLILKPQNEKAP